MAKDNIGGDIIDLDAILEQLGPFGKYNVVNYAMLLFPIYLAGIYGSVYVFEAPDINYSVWRGHWMPSQYTTTTSLTLCWDSLRRGLFYAVPTTVTSTTSMGRDHIQPSSSKSLRRR